MGKPHPHDTSPEMVVVRRPEIHKVRCPECGRRFDLMNDQDAGEWYFGHDCEVD